MASQRGVQGKSSRGRFIVLDGVDGCGKSTQARRLVTELTRPGHPAPLHVREPGSTPVGEALRGILLNPALPLDAGAQALLFVAARRCMLSQLVEPALSGGRDVVCERFHGSTFAYQSVAGEVQGESVLALMGDWAGAPAPDLTILLELSTEEARARADARGVSDRFEESGIEFHARVAQGFADYAVRTRGVVRVDAAGSEDEVAQRIFAEARNV